MSSKTEMGIHTLFVLVVAGLVLAFALKLMEVG